MSKKLKVTHRVSKYDTTNAIRDFPRNKRSGVYKMSRGDCDAVYVGEVRLGVSC